MESIFISHCSTLPISHVHWIFDTSLCSRIPLQVIKYNSADDVVLTFSNRSIVFLQFVKTSYSCIPLMIDPKRPTIPRNSTLLRFFTVYSWHTLEMAYRVALTRTRPSPRRMSLAVDTGINNEHGFIYVTIYDKLCSGEAACSSLDPCSWPARMSAPTMAPTPARHIHTAT